MIKNGMFNLVGQSVKLGSNIIMMPLLVRYLGLESFGLLSWTTAILASVQIAEGGLSSGLLFFLSEQESHEKSENTNHCKNEILTSGIMFLLVSSFLVFLILSALSPFFISTLDIEVDQKKDIKTALLIGSLLVSIRIVQSFFWAVLQSRQLYKTYNTISTLQILTTNISWILLAYSRENSLPIYITLALVTSAIFTLILIPIALKVLPFFQWRLRKKTSYRMIKYNLGVWGSNMGSILFSQGDKIIVGNTLGLRTLATYTIFTNIVSQLNQFTAQAIHPILPLISSRSSSVKGKTNEILNSAKNFFLLNTYISIGGAGLLIIMTEPILQFFLNDDFEKSYSLPFQLLSLIYGIYTLSVTGYYISLGLGYSKKVMLISIVSGSLTLLSIYYFSSTGYGLLAVVLSNCFFFTILILLFQGMLEIGIPFRTWIKIVVVPLAIVIVLTLFLSLVTLSIFFKILLSILFGSFMIISFFLKFQGRLYIRYEFINKLLSQIKKYE